MLAAHAKPAKSTPRNNNRQHELDKPPRLDDTLAVAKSPFEPITLAPAYPSGARFNEFSKETLIESAGGSPGGSGDYLARTTRTLQDVQQESSSTTTKALEAEESTGLAEEGGKSESSETVTESTAETTEATTGPPEDEETTTETPTTTTTTTTTTTAPESTSASTSSTTAAPTTTTTNALASTESPKVEVIKEQEVPETTTTPAPTTTTTSEPPTTTQEPTTTTTPEPSTTTTTPEPSTTSTTTTTTAAPEVPTTEAPSSPSPSSSEAPATEKPTESDFSATEEPETTTPADVKPTVVKEAEQPVANNPDREQPEQPTTTTTEQPTTTTTTEAATTTTTTAPTTTTTTTTTTPPPPPPPTTVVSTTVEPEPSRPPTEAPKVEVPERKKDEDGEEEEAKKMKPACNHLPTYNAEEVQKVFREETTFKNGTIKGKFTYINFDQRYRLVHYTRLPYGPVKIDLVEELGKPEQTSGGGSSPQPLSPNEIPNAVLQLRNIIPNSLFGFPFMSQQPNPQQASRPAVATPPKHDDDKSSMYFYSTDSLSTPNLLSPSVPVSLLPGQKINQVESQRPLDGGSIEAHHRKQTSVLANSQQPFGLPATSDKLTPAKVADDAHQPQPYYQSPSPMVVNRQFQYSNMHHQQQQQQQQTVQQPESKNYVYTYLTHTQPTHYQYSPLPGYPHLPATLSQQVPDQHRSPPPAVAASYDQMSSQDELTSRHDPASHYSRHHHQPHGHEHYVAPFMFSQPPSPNGETNESSKLRLRVKTSKSLNHDAGTKSAQLRVQSQGYSSPVNSPMQAHYQRRNQQRLGKQNQELKTVPINSSPVVYHVLRSPIGQMYTLPRYNQNYAVAYDHGS